jgi:putative (di)nucleoside polyphosphate hydrolase
LSTLLARRGRAENTGVKAVSHGTLVMSAAGELLLCHATGAKHWDIPKGMATASESSAAAASREAQEECGLQLDPEGLVPLGLFAYRPDKDLSLHAALIERVDPARCVCSTFFIDRWGRRRPEMDAFRWALFDEVPTMCARSMAVVLSRRVSLASVLDRLRGLRRIA